VIERGRSASRRMVKAKRMGRVVSHQPRMEVEQKACKVGYGTEACAVVRACY